MSDALRQIIASFGVDFDGKGLKQADSGIQGMIGKLKGFAVAAAGAFAVKEVLGFTMGLAEQAVELEHHAEALGISAQSLQKWDFAASLSGVSAEELQIGLQKLQRSAVGAGGKGGDLGATFEKLHVTVKNANGSFKNADELLTDVAGAIGDMTDPTLQTATAMQIFGRGGARLLPFLKQGRAGVAGLKAEVEALGGGFTDDFIEKSKAMVQDSKRMEFAFTSFKVKALGPLIPILTHMAESATKWIVAAGNVAAKSNVAKAALIALGVGGAIALAPLLLSIAPLIAGFLILEDVLTFLTGGDSLTGDLLDKFFGPGAAAKVKAFTDGIANDLGPVLKAALAIFTDGQPLDVKFQELNNYITTKLGPGSKAVFGEIVSDIQLAVQVVTDLINIVKELSAVLTTLTTLPGGNSLFNAGGFSLKALTGQNDKDQQEFAQNKKAGGRVANEGDIQANLEAAPWYEKLVATVTGFKAEDAVPVDVQKHIAGQNVAAAPVGAAAFAQPPEVKQMINTPITQNFYGIEDADDAGRAASKGAAAGVKSGTNDRALRALVPQAGS